MASPLVAVAALLSLCVSFAIWSESSPPRPPDFAESAITFRLCEPNWPPFCVIDGDTLYMDGTRVRLADIDAPEVSNPACGLEAQRGQQATRRLLELINAGPFSLAHTTGGDKDTYGRKLRVLTRDGRSLGDTLIQEGLARPSGGFPVDWCA